MESKNNVVVLLLVVLIGIVAGVGLLTGVNNAVSSALSPLNAKLASIEREQRNIENKLNTQQGPDVATPLANIQRDLTMIQYRLMSMNNGSNGQPQQPQQPQAQQPPPEDMNKVYNIPVGISSVLGNPNAKVTITEFSDFQCPFCSRFYSVIKDVLGAYPNQVRVVVKNFPLPFHPNARPAAKLAMAANEQGKFQGMMESLLANGGDVSDDKIKEYAKNLGLDYNKLMADYKNKDAQWEQQIQQDMQLAQGVDVRGTPTFYLNGRKTNSRDLSSFKAQIDPLLAGK